MFLFFLTKELSKKKTNQFFVVVKSKVSFCFKELQSQQIRRDDVTMAVAMLSCAPITYSFILRHPL